MPTDCLSHFKPAFTSAFYTAQIDVVGKHLSGILVIKKMEDSSTRIVFSNEIGFTFFDFEFSEAGTFRVIGIMPQMNKKPVLRTLRKDFELIMMAHLDFTNAIALKDSSRVYIGFPQSQGIYYYQTDNTCSQLLKLERASRKKVVVIATMLNYQDGIPDSIGISHKNFNFDIGLKRLNKITAQ